MPPKNKSFQWTTKLKISVFGFDIKFYEGCVPNSPFNFSMKRMNKTSG